MIDRSCFFGTNIITPHPGCQMARQRGKSRTSAHPITVLQISDHESWRPRKGYLQRQRKLRISDSVLHAEYENKKGTIRQEVFAPDVVQVFCCIIAHHGS